MAQHTSAGLGTVESSRGAAWGPALRGAVGYAKESSDAVLIAVLVSIPILFTPYLGDDTINSTLPGMLARGETTLWQHILKYTLQWIHNEGRFFPGSLTWTYTVFATFTDRLAYKSLLFVLSIACLMTVWVFFRWALGRRPSVPTALVLSGLWALRESAYDPLTSFAGLLPMTVTASLAGTMLLGSSRRVLVVLGGLLWAVSLTTYEVSILLVPALVWVLGARRARTGALVLCSVAVMDLAIVFVLRQGMTGPPSPGYALSLGFPEWPRTSAIQLVSALPVSSWWLPGTDVELPLRALILWVVIFVTVTILSRTSEPLGGGTRSGIRGTIPLASVGVSAWVLPSVLIGATARWQGELTWGTAYLSVLWGYVGLGILIALAIELLMAVHWMPGMRHLVNLSIWSGLATLAACTFVSNLTLASRLSGLGP